MAGALVWFVDIGAAVSLLQQTDWRWILIALLLVQIQMILSAWRWQVTAARLGQSLSVPVAIREYYLASAINMSLPGGITGDAARVVRARHGSTLSVAAQGVMLERLAGQIALLFITLLGWLLWPLLMDSDAPSIEKRLLSASLGVLGCLLLAKVLLIIFANNCVARFVSSLGPAMHRVWIADRQWLFQTVLNATIVASYLLVFAVCTLALGDPLPLAAILSIVPLVLMSMVLPLSVGGWGVREAAAAAMWPLAGLSAESGIASSVLYGLVAIVGCLPGLLFFALERRRQSRRSVDES